MTELMREIDRDFQAASGLTERRLYKIYYSHIHPFPLLVLGQNPGGETDGTDLAASDSYFENWEHDYVRFRHELGYSLAGPMCKLLACALETSSVDALRQIPATNIIFRRSRNTSRLNLKLHQAAVEAQPFLNRILQAVNPSTVLLISKTAYGLFVRHHCERKSLREDPSSRIFTPNGLREACVFLAARARVSALGREASLFMVGHPSKFAGRAEWPSVISVLRAGFRRVGISPLKSCAALREIEPIPSYGARL